MTWPLYTNVPLEYPLLTIRNVGAQTFYLGGPNVTATAGLPCAPGAAVQVPLYASSLTGTSLSIATDGQVTLPTPKRQIGDDIGDLRAKLKALPYSHSRELALNALAACELWSINTEKDEKAAK
jgi:hypothetical protein